MVLCLLLLQLILVLDQSDALTKPGQVKPTVKQKTEEADQKLKVLWLVYNFLTKEDRAILLSAILPPYLGAVFRSTKSGKNTIRNMPIMPMMPYPRIG